MQLKDLIGPKSPLSNHNAARKDGTNTLSGNILINKWIDLDDFVSVSDI